MYASGEEDGIVDLGSLRVKERGRELRPVANALEVNPLNMDWWQRYGGETEKG